jgi:hypothetical protein
VKLGVVLSLVFSCITAPSGAPDEVTISCGDATSRLAPYRFERGSANYEDIVSLRSGIKKLGKAMEFGDRIVLFQAGDLVESWPVSDVADVQFQRTRRHKTRSPGCDLTVAYVERLPRDSSWQGHVVTKDGLPVLDSPTDGVQWRPAVGSKVTFRVHVLNAGSADSSKVPISAFVEGKEIKRGTLPPIAPGADQVFEVEWEWREAQSNLRIEIDPQGGLVESLRWNNAFEEPIGALGVCVIVGRGRYAEFSRTPNIVDSYCFEDWLQYQIRTMNELFERSIYPSAKHGIEERVRCDRIIVVEDPVDENQAAQWKAQLKSVSKSAFPEYQALVVLDSLEDKVLPEFVALKVDWNLLRDLGGQLGLIDLHRTDTTPGQCVVRDRFDRYAGRQHLFPWPETMMYTVGPFPFSEVDAGFLNRTRGRPRGAHGSFLYQLPEKIAVEARSNLGRPLADIQVDVFSLQNSGEYAGYIAGFGRGDPMSSSVTGEDGRVWLVNQETPSHRSPDGYELKPNPFGHIACDGSNGLLLLRLRQQDREEFHFLRLFDCNVAFLRGQQREYVHVLKTHFAEHDAPPSPMLVAYSMDERLKKPDQLSLVWPHAAPGLKYPLREYRVYKRLTFAGNDASQWTLAGLIRRDRSGWALTIDQPCFLDDPGAALYPRDTSFAVAAVDRQGVESVVSETTYVPSGGTFGRLAIEGDAAHIALQGENPRLLRWDGNAGTQPFPVQCNDVPGYQPSFAGVTIGADHRIVVADPVNHVLAWYDDRGELNDVMPRRESWPGYPSAKQGEFFEPADVATDTSGRLYVADKGNNRVQILDASGAFSSMLDPDFQFEGPHALGFANGRLCVTDKQGARCRVYDLTIEPPAFMVEADFLIGADRALVGRSGKIYTTGRFKEDGEAGVMVFSPQDKLAKFERVDTEAEMGKLFNPSGMYLYVNAVDEDYAYFVNGFPFDVRRYRIE